MARTWFIGALLILVSALFVGNVWQSYRYTRMERDVQSLRREHLAVLEENKRLIVGVAGLRSPRRVRAIAEEELGLIPLPADRIQRIDIGRGTGGE
ncbi:MAG: hypothetical protein EA427_10345 [Spirochaetaceae bacterium]|nr:MAG: hypothetical protein EA427_10345 [Spirochaetaceae bacterium]